MIFIEQFDPGGQSFDFARLSLEFLRQHGDAVRSGDRIRLFLRLVKPRFQLGDGLLAGILVGGVISELLGYGAAFWTVVLVNAAGVACFFLATKAFFLQRNLNPTVR